VDSPVVWQVFAASVPGASHLASEIPNQDALRVEPDKPSRPPFVATLADGHGDSRHCRSDRGARFATWAATVVLVDFLKVQERSVAFERHLKKVAQDSIAREIIKEWTKSVFRDLELSPLETLEFSSHGNPPRPDIIKEVVNNPLLAYGSTVLGIGVTDSEVIAVQLGDGDILVAGPDGNIYRPFPDTAHQADDLWMETDSLASEDAWRQVKVTVIPIDPQLPLVLLLSTDGYRKAFLDEEAYEKVIPDFLAVVRSQGHDHMQNTLGDILSRTSMRSGGDDITVVVVCNGPAIDTHGWVPHSKKTVKPSSNETVAVVSDSGLTQSAASSPRVSSLQVEVNTTDHDTE
jgi:hypothetical protein